MKAFTQRLFHLVLTQQFEAIHRLEIDEKDRVGMDLLSVLIDQRLVDHTNVTLLDAKKRIETLRTFLEGQPWFHDEDYVLLAMLLRLGSDEFKTTTGVFYPRFKVYFPNRITKVYLTQPKIKGWLDSIQDNKHEKPFLDLLKGMYYAIFQDPKLSNRYLKNVIDPDRKRMATYFMAMNDLRLGHMDAVKDHVAILRKDKHVFPWMLPGLNAIEETLYKFHHLDFFHDIQQLYDTNKINDYMLKVFDKELWNNADAKTKVMVSTAFYLASRMSRLLEDGPIQDYSAFALPFVKAYEHECYKLFFRGFIQYLKKEGVSPQQAIPRHSKHGRYFAIVKMDEKPLQYQEPIQENFSIGNIPYILDINHKLAKAALDQVDPSGLVVAPHFEAYWEKKTRKLPSSYQGRSVLIDAAKKAFLISKLRNKMTHAEMLTFDEFKAIVSAILESKQLTQLMTINAG